MLPAAFSALLVAATQFVGGYYPTEPDAMDRYCQVIGEAPDASVPPRDRLWFQESCHCSRDAGCGRLGSERFWKRREAAYDAWRRKQSSKGNAPRTASPAPVPH